MHITVCYASETGTAEDVAFKIVTKAEALCLDVEVVSIDDYNIESLPAEQMIVFVCSTTGDGEVPTSMRAFWKFILRKSLPRNSLENVKFCIFGLGDSGYDKFNAVARRLNSRMKQLSAVELLPIGLGDDQGAYGYLTALDPWMEQLFAKLVPLTALTPDLIGGSGLPPQPPPQYSITTMALSASASFEGGNEEKEVGDRVQKALERQPPVGFQTTTATPMKATVISNTRLTAPSWKQNVFHLTMTIPPLAPPQSPSSSSSSSSSSSLLSSPLSHMAGDVLIVYPSNSPHLVALAESYFSTEFPDPANTVLNIQYTPRKNTRKNRLMGGQCSASTLRCTVRELFTHFLGLSNVPQRGYFEELSRFVPELSLSDDKPLTAAAQALLDENEEEREKLVELASASGADQYDSYCFQEQRGFLEILTEFRSLRNGQVPLHRFLELVPPLLPRHYSIASSGCKTPNEVHLCVAEVAYKTRLGRSRTGVASNFLSRLQSGECVYCYVRKGTFPTVPLDAPLLLIGPGTGVAPMRALMHERIALAASPSESTSQSATVSEIGKKTSVTLLLFGCRSQQDDYLYESEWHQCLEDVGVNGTVVTNCNSEDKAEILPPFDFSSNFSEQKGIQLYSPDLSLPPSTSLPSRSSSHPTAVVVTAFSRQGRHAGRRVTHSLHTHREAVWSLIRQEDAHILVAGSASTKMPSDVRSALARVCVEAGGLTPEEAQLFLLRMEKTRRFCVEAWS